MDVHIADYDGSCFVTLGEHIFTAKKQAEENYNNQFGTKDTHDIRYLHMRERQAGILREMYKCVRNIHTVPSTATTVADFLEKVSSEYHRDNDVAQLLEELGKIRTLMKTVPLPQNRAEFEDRANLFMLLERLEEFLAIKRDFVLGKAENKH